MARRHFGGLLVVIGTVVVAVGVVGLVTDAGSSDAGDGVGQHSAATPTTSTRPNEDPRDFFSAYIAAVRSGDAAALDARFHPAVTERYGAAQCATAAAGLADPGVDLRLVGVDGPTQYDYASDGLSTSIPDVYVFHVDGTASGRTGPRDYHFAIVDGRFRTFLDCGTPVQSR